METLFAKNTICLSLKAQNKEEVIDELISLLAEDNVLNDREAYKKAIYAREEASTTGIGFGIAIPHAKSAAVKLPRVAIGLSQDGVDYGSEDGEKVNLMFMIAVGDDGSNLHLQTLAKLSRKLVNAVFRTKLMQCETKEEVLSMLADI